MKNTLTIILTLLSLNLLGQDFNSTMNDNIYLLREVNNNINNYQINNVEFYDTSGVVGSIEVGLSVDKIADVMKYLIDNSKTKIVSIKLNSNSNVIKISTSNNTILEDTLTELVSFSKTQLDYMNKYNVVTHRRNNVSFDKRFRISNLETDGVFTENCSKVTFYEGSDYALSIKILRSYFNARHVTEHWNSLMRNVYKYYETIYTKSGNKVYSLTTMHSNITYKTKKGA